MANNIKLRTKIWFIVKSIVAGSVVVTRTFAAPAIVVPNHVDMVDGWRALGEQMNGNAAALPRLDQALIDMIAAADLDKNLADVVLATYEMVDRTEMGALDAHWAAVLTAAGNAALVAEFLNLRSELGQSSSAAGDADAVIWLAAKKDRDGCDLSENNGWGNGDQDSPGESGPNNNGENYEGGNQNGLDDGSSNSSDNRRNK